MIQEMKWRNNLPLKRKIPLPERHEIQDQIPKEIHGSDILKEKLKLFFHELKNIVSTKLRPTPANIPPCEIQCDLSKWKSNKNRAPARPQTAAKQAECIRQINDMVANNVIKQAECIRQINDMVANNVIIPSQATEHSQVLLTPKPDNKWRFCVDYRSFNDCCSREGWPIPNISLMMQRIGLQKPKPTIFGKIDLTSGYHQAPISLVSSVLTAFITIIGVFQWLRVPMGLKGAPSYFQQIIATVVLVGLIHNICELYIDDILIYAATEEEFIRRVRLIFQRFNKHSITLNPNKCSLGVSQVEFVGHTISSEGINFSRERIDAVLDIPPPIYQKGIKRFLGIANYMRDHIKNHSVIVRPLQQLVQNYTPTTKVKWTPEATQAFEDIKRAINECPTLSFLHETAPIYLNTDASDYGIGAYLFQLVDGKEVPVAFMSRALSERES